MPNWLHRVEDAYYRFLDAVDSVIPVYRIVDPIDKIVPSMYVFGLLLLFFVGGLFFYLFNSSVGNVSLYAVSSDGFPISGITVEGVFNKEEFSLTTDGTGRVLFESVPAGTHLFVTLSGEEWETLQKEIIVNRTHEPVKIVLMPISLAPPEWTFHLVDASHQIIQGKNGEIHLACENGMSFIPTTESITDGFFSITPPLGCEKPKANIQLEGYVPLSQIALSPENTVISLEKKSIPTGRAEWIIQKDEGNTPLSGVNVQAFTSTHVLAGEKKTNLLGYVSFDLEGGDYYFSFLDESGNYGVGTSPIIEIAPHTVHEERWVLSKSIKGTLVVRAVDAFSNQPIQGANVIVLSTKTNTVIAEKQTNSEGIISTIGLTTGEGITIVVKHPDYVYSKKVFSTIQGETETVFSLSLANSENSGIVNVTVRDEKGMPVLGAIVQLIDITGTGTPIGITITPTDAQGRTSVKGIPTGNYAVSVMKGNYSYVETPPFFLEKGEPTQVDVVLTLGESTVQVEVVDSLGKIIPFATVLFHTLFDVDCPDETCLVQADEKGIATHVFKADRYVYIQASAPGYVSLTTTNYSLIPGKKIMIKPFLRKEEIGSDVQVQLEGWRDTLTGKSVSMLKPGGHYTGKFRVTIPQGKWKKIGIHVREGYDGLLDTDTIAIHDLIGSTGQTEKGTTYSQVNGWEYDSAHVTNGDGKWGEWTWNSDTSGDYWIDVQLYVNDSASLGGNTPLYYRAWGETEDGLFIRSPADATLELAENTSEKNKFYADSHVQTLFFGEKWNCGDIVCIAGETLLDQDEGVVLGPHSTLIAGREYTYSFIIQAGKKGTNGNIRLTGNIIGDEFPIKITNYFFQTPNGEIIEEKGMDTITIPISPNTISLGSLSTGEWIIGNVTFHAAQNGIADFVLRVYDEEEIVAESSIALGVESLQEMKVNSSVTGIFPFTPTTITIYVNDAMEKPIEGVLVNLYQKGTDGTTILWGQTNTINDGSASATITGGWPGENYIIILQKKDYADASIVLPVIISPFQLTPAEIIFNLPLVGNAREVKELSIQNIAGSPFTISGMSLQLSPHAWLDEKEMKENIQQQEGMEIAPGKKESFFILAQTKPVVKINQTQLVSGSILVEGVNSYTNQKYLANIPLTIHLAPLSDCQNGGIVLNGIEGERFEIRPFEHEGTIPFTLSHDCIVGGDSVEMRHIQAKVDWSGNALGQLVLSIKDPETQETYSQVLQKGAYTPLASQFLSIEKGEYDASLTFIPYKPLSGKTGGFTLSVGGEIGNPEAPILVSKTIPIQVGVNTLESCVKIAPEPGKGVTIRSGENKATFLIDVTACKTPVEVAFCIEQGNEGCSGGAPKGAIEVQPLKQVITKTNTFTIKRTQATLPGSYDVTVHARIQGNAFERIARLDVKMRATQDRAFDMTKTAFVLFGKDSEDTTIVLNRLYKEKVSVTAAVCHWMTSSQQTDEGFWVGQAAGTAVSTAATQLASSYIVPQLASAALAPTATAATQTAANVGAYAFSSLGSTIGGMTGAGPILTKILSFMLGCPVCIIIGIIVAILVSMMMAEDVDLCEMFFTVTDMDDYIIHLKGITEGEEVVLPPDAINVQLSSNISTHFKGKWVLNEQEIFNDTEEDGDDEEGEGKEIQSVGARFTNIEGYANTTPLFGVVTLRATEHIHGDAEHKGEGKVSCVNGEFQNYKIGPEEDHGSCDGTEDTIREEKFHVKFKTAEHTQTLPFPYVNAEACNAGTIQGNTGEEILPKIAYNWRWDEEYGVPMGACDAENANGIYCDATQFNIDLMKRLRALEEFLEANNYTFDCPTNPNSQPQSVFKQVNKIIKDEKVGVKGIGYSITKTNEITFTASIENRTLMPVDGNMIIYLFAESLSTDYENAPKPIDLSCTSVGTIDTGKTAEYVCSIPNLAAEKYDIMYVFGLPDDGTQSPVVQFLSVNVNNYVNKTIGHCPEYPKSTKLLGGKPALNQWIDGDDEEFGQYVNEKNVIFTPSVPNVETLNKLTHFTANLMADGYSDDFKDDFANYYNKISFADAPPWFVGSNEHKGYRRFYEKKNALEFVYKYGEQTYIHTPGKYSIDMDVEIEGDDWQFFDLGGKPKAKIKIQFYLLDTPIINSPFYRIPIDGEVGLVNGVMQREGYGMEYAHENGFIKINDSFVETHDDMQKDGSFVLHTLVERGITQLNTRPETRGRLLYVNAPTGMGDYTMAFSPSIATPLIAKVSHAQTNQPFSVYYSLSDGGEPVITGETLNYWDGVQGCMDYEGMDSAIAFNQKPDRRANNEEQLTNWQYVYAQDWGYASTGGNAYLHTLFYTPTDGSFTLSAEKQGIQFATSNYPTFTTTQFLDGVSSVEHNNPSQVVDSIQDVFDLVAKGDVCVYDNGVEALFYWNDDALYQAMGANSMDQIMSKLTPNQTCI
ncbi:MAG: carboxypeptidase regulatory-like domain-containing protein [Candidatus Diapherotrites archaeon]